MGGAGDQSPGVEQLTVDAFGQVGVGQPQGDEVGGTGQHVGAERAEVGGQSLTALAHGGDMGPALIDMVEHHLGGGLGQRRDGVVDAHLHHHRQGLRLGDGVADAQAGEAVGLGEGAQANHAGEHLAGEGGVGVVAEVEPVEARDQHGGDAGQDEQHEAHDPTDIPEAQIERTFRTNIFSMFYFVKGAAEHMPEGSTIVNCTSVPSSRGSPALLDYSATKGAITAFTRSLAKRLWEKRIRVNAVAPGPIWTPLIPASFDAESVKEFGKDTLMGRAGQPIEAATCFVFLACRDSSYLTGQVLHPNGGDMVGG